MGLLEAFAPKRARWDVPADWPGGGGSGAQPVLRLDAVDRLDELEQARALADRYNALTVALAGARRQDLTPTRDNAARLGLFDTSGGGPPTQASGVVNPGLGFGVRGVQAGPAWTPLLGDAATRLQTYATELPGIPAAHRLGLDASLTELEQGARVASAQRNAVLQETRAKLSPLGLQLSKELKEEGRPFEQLVERYATKTGEDPRNPGDKTYRAVTEAAGRSNPWVTRGAQAMQAAQAGMNWAAKPLAVAGAGLDGYSLGTEISRSMDSGDWRNTGREAVRIGAGWPAAMAGAELGASGGATLGAMTGPFALGAVPAFSLIGGLGGGLLGYTKGGDAGQWIYDTFFGK